MTPSPRATAPDGNAVVRLIAEARLPGARGRYEDFLPETEAISQRRHSPYATWLIYTLSALVIAVVAWMQFSQVDEVATVPGVVRATAKARPISHPDGGRIVAVLVKDGDSVDEDQALILLDDDQVVRAPIEGVINGLKPYNPGATIGPGETVAGVVPADAIGRIEIEARVSNRDIGAITVGQDATLRMQAYDWVRYGTIKATVVHIAMDGVGTTPQPTFVVRIAPDKTFVGHDPNRNRLMPGMTASVDLHVGERSILEFFTGALWRTVGGSLHERGG